MARGNTHATYGSVTKTFHWLTALLILSAFPLGILAHDAPYDTSEQLTRKALLFSLHKTVGVMAFFTALLRILWALTQPRPGLLNADRRLEALAAETAHWVLYGCMLLVPLTGWIHHAAAEGFAPIWWPFGQTLPFIPKDAQLSAICGSIHTTLTPVFAVTILAHVGGALKHAIIDKDHTLRRMLPGASNAPTPPAQSHTRLPFVLALGIWAVAMTVGVLSTPQAAQTQQVALSEVKSQWAVQEGEIALTIRQFGNDVRGSFADWTADITFSETASEGKHGTADVQIAIGSLSLGSVTQQAMGADFFDATTFPTASFTADLVAHEQGHMAEGTLTIKGASVPVSFPFTLTIEGDTATVSAQTTLNRQDFNVGQSMPDESSLGFAVIIDITLTATR
ncbi:cytochrome b/b6 domain-containing protein [Cognatishimia sp.]|uniref:cytochrome b/b6 domain-containing protein n=1 Tax=Cognatishimia sp. TaxID=2211648 RepID=UPI003511A788